jgi:glutathione peroxidase
MTPTAFPRDFLPNIGQATCFEQDKTMPLPSTVPLATTRHGPRRMAASAGARLLGLNRAGVSALGALALLMALSAPPAAAGTQPGSAATACPPLLQQRFLRLQDERPVDLCQYAGQVVLVVNTASQCGYTRQYESLQALHQRYAARGLVVMGFPSGDFGGQELASNTAIAEFCENNFAVRFPMFAKTVVKPGAGTVNPLFESLAQRTGERPRWNFHKYLVDRQGQRVISIGSDVDPLAPSFIRTLEGLLAAR